MGKEKIYRAFSNKESSDSQQTVSSTEDLYHVLFEEAADGIFLSDEMGRYIEVNKRSCEMLGYSREEILKHGIDDFTPEDERREKPVKLDDLHIGQKIAFERNLICKGERLLPVEINVRRLPNGTHLAIVRDITDRKQAELAITQVLEWQEAIFEGSRDAVFISNAESQFVAVNNAACELTGYPNEELLRMSIPDIHDEPDLEAYKMFHNRIIAGESALSEAKIRRKDGTKVVVEFSNTRISVADVFYMHTVARDITERKRSEEELKSEEEKRLELERLLIQSQKLEGLGTLASGIAHDFNNILNIITGHLSLLKEHLADPVRITRNIDAMEKASDRATSLVKQLLSLARKNETCFDSVVMNDVINEICKLLHETLPKTITLSRDLQPDLPRIFADTSQLHQIFMNLCINARDAMPHGGTITVSTTTISGKNMASRFPQVSGREYVLVRVSDNGIGMNGEVKRKIFEPFFTTKEPGKGTGLGLALVCSIVQSHQGMIDVESEPDKGAAFSLYFPVDERKVVKGQNGTLGLDKVPGGTETILVIEDEALLSDLVMTILVSKGYKVLSAADGEEALTVYKKHHREIALVVTDYGLPKIAGDEVIKQIKKINPSAKIILSSGYIDTETKDELLKSGADRFIVKPYKAAEVLQTVRNVMDSR
jgi:two-component system cell cycle sensor histidine kinase/response regulator CckA